MRNPDFERGSIILQKILNSDEPSTLAASIIDLSIPLIVASNTIVAKPR